MKRLRQGFLAEESYNTPRLFSINSVGKYCGLLVIAVGLCCSCGFSISHDYPPIQKELFSWRIPKSQVGTIKNVILSEGYSRISKDDYRRSVKYLSYTDSTISTQYEKEISTAKNTGRVLIMLSFKEINAMSDFYRNFGITISDLDRDDIPEINAEIARIEEVLYKKLLDGAGAENVVRGARKDKQPSEGGPNPPIIPPVTGRPPGR